MGPGIGDPVDALYAQLSTFTVALVFNSISGSLCDASRCQHASPGGHNLVPPGAYCRLLPSHMVPQHEDPEQHYTLLPPPKFLGGLILSRFQNFVGGAVLLLLLP